MAQEGYYERLSLSKEATRHEIKTAYRKLAFQYHPDRNPNDAAAAENMKAINEAYAVLSDDAKRAEYDRMRAMFGERAHDRFRSAYSTEDIFRGSDINDIFETISRMFAEQAFGGAGNAKGRVFYWDSRTSGNDRGHKINNFLLKKFMGAFVPLVGDNVNDVIWVNEGLAQNGGFYTYESIWQDKRLKVTIPPKLKNGQSIRLNGMGKPGKNGGPSGDLLLKVRIRKAGATVLNELADTAKSKLRKFFKK